MYGDCSRWAKFIIIETVLQDNHNFCIMFPDTVLQLYEVYFNLRVFVILSEITNEPLR